MMSILQVVNSSYVWLPMLPRADGLGYALLDLDQWRPCDYMVQVRRPVHSLLHVGLGAQKDFRDRLLA